jgi:hypothetical protein
MTFVEAAPDLFIVFAQLRDLHWGAGPTHYYLSCGAPYLFKCTILFFVNGGIFCNPDWADPDAASKCTLIFLYHLGMGLFY